MNTNRKETAYDRTLRNWRVEWMKENITPEVNRAINLATHDLYYGPALASDCAEPPADEYGNTNEWSGYDFVKACNLIKEALSDLPSELYLDCDCESWSTSEPQGEKCTSCDGKGENEDEDGDMWKCSDCAGEGVVEPYTENTYRVERRDLKVAIVGKELASYV